MLEVFCRRGVNNEGVSYFSKFLILYYFYLMRETIRPRNIPHSYSVHFLVP